MRRSAAAISILLLSAPSAAAWATRSAADGPLGPARWSLSLTARRAREASAAGSR